MLINCKKYNIPWREKLNYRKKSLLDFVLENLESSDQINLLNEYCRSLPDIICFSNEKFYDKPLLVMNGFPKYRNHKSVFMYKSVVKEITKV